MRIRIKKVPPQNGLKVANDQYKTLSSDGVNLLGKSHKKGGTYVSSNGEVVEAEAGEPIYTDSLGNNVVFGNVENPATKTKFKNEAKDLLKKKGKAEKKEYGANLAIEESDPYSKLGSLEFNSAVVNLDAATVEKRDLKANLDTLANIQQAILSTAEQINTDPKKLSKKLQKSGGTVKVKIKGAPTMQDGGIISPVQNFMNSFLGVPVPSNVTVPVSQAQAPQPTPLMTGTFDPKSNEDKSALIASIRMAAQNHGVDPDLFEKQIYQESSFNPKAKSKAGAKGIAQFMPATAREMGLNPDNLVTDDWSSIEEQIDAAARYMSQLKNQFGGDDILAAAAYNGGAGNIRKNLKELARREGRDVNTLTGQDWYNFMSTRDDKPKGQLETINYVNNIAIKPSNDFWDDKGGAISNFRKTYYEAPPTPPERVDLQPIDTGIQVQPLPVEAPTANNVQPIPQERISAEARAQPKSTPKQEVAPLERTRLSPMNFLGEMAALFDQPDFVQGQQYNPNLMQPYRVSFQDRINQNTANFNALSKNFADNPEALATLAGQKYQQDQQILAEEFRVNQGIQNQVANQNVGILNQAQLQNIQLSDQQYARQAQAAAVTDQNRINALNSISNKYAQNELYNQSRELLQQRRNVQSSATPNYSFNQGTLQLDNLGGYQWYATPQQVIPLTPQQASQQSQLEAAKKAAQAAFGHKFKKK